jgi:hypothetical protein
VTITGRRSACPNARPFQSDQQFVAVARDAQLVEFGAGPSARTEKSRLTRMSTGSLPLDRRW